MSWEVDGADIPLDRVASVAYQTRRIERFLEQGSRRRVLCGSKGMGKTLLLSLKRKQLFADYRVTEDRNESSVTFIPVNRPFLDYMSPLPDLDRRWHDQLSDCDFSEQVWATALRISCLSHVSGIDRYLQGFDLPEPLDRWVRGELQVAPSLVCHELLRMSLGQFHRFYADRWNDIDLAFRKINVPLFLFIDKVDQACSQFRAAAWINFQGGLLMAVADLSKANAHVKAFATIRHEAFANIHQQKRANAKSVVTELEYSEEDLERLLDQLARVYEQDDSFTDFLGRDTVVNTMAGCKEASYRYIRRHTLCRPRDLVAIADALSDLERPIQLRSFQDCTNRRASEIVGNEVFSELLPFLAYLRSPVQRAELFRLIPSNVLRRRQVEIICERVNGGVELDDYSIDGIAHPFCELYTAGLLGVVVEGNEPGSHVQRFKRPSDRQAIGRRELPRSEFYLLHPALMGLLRSENQHYRVLRLFPVGDGYPWGAGWSALSNAQLEFFEVESQLDSVDRERFWTLLGWAAGMVPGRGIDGLETEIDGRTAQRVFRQLEQIAELTAALVWVDELKTAVAED